MAIEYRLEDDGTLDTVILAWDDEEYGPDYEPVELRYSVEVAAEYRDANGCLDFARFCSEIVADDADEELSAAYRELGEV
jgi:hypothetical protein